MKTRSWFRRFALFFGFAFLYVPILSMIFFSFNNSRLVTVWDADDSPTLKWYRALLSNEQILGAAWLHEAQVSQADDQAALHRPGIKLQRLRSLFVLAEACRGHRLHRPHHRLQFVHTLDFPAEAENRFTHGVGRKEASALFA